MKILVINTAASEGGALSILTDFASYIEKNDSENMWYFLLSDDYIKETKNIKTIVLPELKSHIHRLGFENIYGAKLIKDKLSPDVVFSMQNTTIRFLNIPQVLYLHQPLPFQKEKKFSFLKKDERLFAFKQYLVGAAIKSGLKRANKVIVQTNWMKNALIENKISKKAIEVIAPQVKVETLNVVEGYKSNSFFYPTSDLVYKNIDIIEKATNELERKKLDYKVEITVNRNNRNSIHYIGKIDRKTVFRKLSQSVLLFPSYIESFGLPLMEGRQLNSIILAADTEFSREILNGYDNAYFFNKNDVNQLSVLMEKAINGELRRKKEENIKIQKFNSWELVKNCIINV